MESKEYRIVLGILFVAEFAIFALTFIFFVFLFGIQSFFVVNNSPSETEGIVVVFIIYGLLLAVYLFLMLTTGIAGWKLLKQKPNARIWCIIASICSILFFVPFGFAICIFGLWFCFGGIGKNYFLYGEQMPERPNYYPPQPPNQWQ